MNVHKTKSGSWSEVSTRGRHQSVLDWKNYSVGTVCVTFTDHWHGHNRTVVPLHVWSTMGDNVGTGNVSNKILYTKWKKKQQKTLHNVAQSYGSSKAKKHMIRNRLGMISVC